MMSLTLCLSLIPGCGGGGGEIQSLMQPNINTVTNSGANPGNTNNQAAHVVYSIVGNGNYELHVMDLGGKNGIQLLSATGTSLFDFDANDTSPIIVYSIGVLFDNDIFSVNSDGTSKIKLANNSYNEYSPKLSADNSKIFFNRSIPLPDDVYHFNIFSVSPTGTQEKQYLDSTLRISVSPFEIAPDESFAIYPDTLINTKKIIKYDAATTKETILFSSGTFSTHFYISPDSKKILIFTDYNASGAYSKLHVMDPSGKDILTLSKVLFSNAAWAPDSDRFAYIDYTSTNGFMVNIYSMNSKTTTLIKSGKDFMYIPLDWADDGSKILAFKGDLSGSDTSDLVYFNPDGTNETLVKHFNADPDKGLGMAYFVK